MKTAIVTLSVTVMLDVPDELAGKVTRDDLISMARECIPDSMTCPGPPTGTQVTVEDVGQEKDGQPVFAGVFVEHDFCGEGEIEFEDEGFTVAENPTKHETA